MEATLNQPNDNISNQLNNKLNIMKQILHKTLGLRAWMMVAMIMAAVTGAWLQMVS